MKSATRVLFGLGAVRQHSRTLLLRVAGFEDENEEMTRQCGSRHGSVLHRYRKFANDRGLEFRPQVFF